MIQGTRTFLGYFKTEKAAAEAVSEYRKANAPILVTA